MDASPPAHMASSPSAPASAAAEQEPDVSPNTRVRSGSPGNTEESGGGGTAHGGASYPTCQVEHCRADLTGAKAYHRRHKVCAKCSLSAETFVAGRMHRFCQHCSRFHLLAEFDGHRRSCRRRLAGFLHQQRRRRIRPAEAYVDLQSLILVNQEIAANRAQDVVDHLVEVVTSLQGHMNRSSPSARTAPPPTTRPSSTSTADSG